MTISILGSGAFGTSLAITLAQNSSVVLWARNPEHAAEMAADRENRRRLPGTSFPNDLTVVSSIDHAVKNDLILVAVPMQRLGGFLEDNAQALAGKRLVACCKGIDQATGHGPIDLINSKIPSATAAVLTGPSFAVDIARGMPTALSIACADETICAALQSQLSTPALRLYRTTDVIGTQLGGALKNVIAIACGAVIGAGLGESARAALMTRGFAEMNRLAMYFGAHPQTLAGLSGFGDLTLTCTSASSRNYRYGVALGSGDPFDSTTTVEGAATSLAVRSLCQKHRLDMPITQSIAAIVDGKSTVETEIEILLSRPLKEE
jgi:glycerol-3-phosphate dehydrogenase (NAD(P)+)